ncbi:signal peptidase I [candidate division KSB1 bacterium]
MFTNSSHESSTPTRDAHDESQTNNSDTPPLPTKHTEGKSENFGIEILKIVILAIIIVTPIRIFIAQPFVVSGASMDDTFANGQYLIVDQLSYRFDEPKRGEVIIFRFPLEPSKFFIKRIIGLPNEQVILQGKATIIINEENPDGLVLDESYLSLENVDDNSYSTTLGSGEYFVMGDNRKESSDSRSWGVLNKEHIVGQAFVRLFPITKFNILPGQ